ncbi:MAG: FadR family transcriptional regulator [Pelosinus sp.]|nr:FadR family transcriptional regulator [Pelosinus sp.]
MFKPVKTKKVYEEVIEQIKQLISDGKLQPGDKLPSERELSDEFAVSRASIREAFSALQMMGIITIHPGEGSFVRQVSYEGVLESLSLLVQVDAEDVMKLLEVRKILEIEVAYLAAERASEEDIRDIRDALQHMADEVTSGKIGDAADAEFHLAILKAAHNPILVEIMNAVSELMINTLNFLRQKIFMQGDMPEKLHDSHFSIFEAIAQKKPQLARILMWEHLSMVEEIMVELQSRDESSLNKKSSEKLQVDEKIKTDFGFPS